MVVVWRCSASCLRDEAPTRLCVGVTPWFGQTLLAVAVQAFRREMPAVQLELYEGLQAVSLSLLRTGQMQFALGPAGNLPGQEFAHEPLARYRMRVLASNLHPLRTALTLDETLEEGDISVVRLRDQALDLAARCFVGCLQQALKACARSTDAEARQLADMLRLLF